MDENINQPVAQTNPSQQPSQPPGNRTQDPLAETSKRNRTWLWILLGCLGLTLVPAALMIIVIVASRPTIDPE